MLALRPATDGPLSTRSQVYFILALYSLAIHLRRGTYHNLPLSKPAPPPRSSSWNPHHTRGAPSGGASYSHVRNHSIATSMGDFEGPSTGDSLWEADEFLGQSQKVGNTGEVPPSPAYAKGTGVARAVSGQQPGMLNRTDSGQGVEVKEESPFAKVLGRMSGDWAR